MARVKKPRKNIPPARPPAFEMYHILFLVYLEIVPVYLLGVGNGGGELGTKERMATSEIPGGRQSWQSPE
jgi:hypothetical protein